MTTMLMCGACGRRAGIACPGDDMGLSRTSVVVDQRHGNARSGWGDERGDDHALIWDLDAPRMWPMPIDCEHCGTELELTLDAGRSVGSTRRMILPRSAARPGPSW